MTILFAATSPGDSPDQDCTIKLLGKQQHLEKILLGHQFGVWEWRFVRVIISVWLVNLQLFSWTTHQGRAFAVFLLPLPPATILPLHASALIQPHPCLSPTSLGPGHPSDSSGISHSFFFLNCSSNLCFSHFSSVFWFKKRNSTTYNSLPCSQAERNWTC